MPIRDIKREVVVDKQYVCDACQEVIKKPSLPAWENKNFVLCQKCLPKIPKGVLDSVEADNVIRHSDAQEIMFFLPNVRDSESFDIPDDGFPDLNKGVWAFFSSQNDAEEYSVERLDSIDDIEESCRRHEFGRRGWPLYLIVLLVEGKIRKFKITRKIEIE